MINQLGQITRDPMNANAYRTQRPESPEDIWQPLYDRVNVATSVPTNLSFFAVPRGQSATLIVGVAAATRTKDYRDTNMDNSNVVPSKLFKILGLSIAYLHTTAAPATDAASPRRVIPPSVPCSTAIWLHWCRRTSSGCSGSPALPMPGTCCSVLSPFRRRAWASPYITSPVIC